MAKAATGDMVDDMIREAIGTEKADKILELANQVDEHLKRRDEGTVMTLLALCTVLTWVDIMTNCADLAIKDPETTPDGVNAALDFLDISKRLQVVGDDLGKYIGAMVAAMRLANVPEGDLQ